MTEHHISPLIFGIYPGGHTGPDTGRAVTPDDPRRIQEALDLLQADNSPFLVRGYLPYIDPSSTEEVAAIGTPVAVEQYARHGCKIDLVLQFRKPDLPGWLAFIHEAINRYNSTLATLQITEEANVTTTPAVDGCIPQAREALVRGVIAAKEAIVREDLDIQVGFNAAPSLDPNDDFWLALAALGGQSFLNALDYVGFDFFPDVFRSHTDIRRAVIAVLAHFRQVNMAAAGIPFAIPIHITEHGWPTGPARSPERQAEVLETVIRTIHEHRGQFNITRYELFTLRDANSSNPALLSQFGLLRDDYSPKPAFERYRQLIAELGT
jgi:hypothetical protein